MSVNGVTSTGAYEYQSGMTAYEKKTVSEKEAAKETKSGVVYEKSSDNSKETDKAKKTYKQDTATIEKLKAEADARTKQLRDVVEQMLSKQGKTLFSSDKMYQYLREGKFEVSDDVRKQAQQDISEDGYWGVKQTSDRLVSFAKALAGGDSSKAEEMMAAVKKGFEQATKTWGDDLPDLCKNTYDETMRKLTDWRDGTETEA